MSLDWNSIAQAGTAGGILIILIFALIKLVGTINKKPSHDIDAIIQRAIALSSESKNGNDFKYVPISTYEANLKGIRDLMAANHAAILRELDNIKKTIMK